MNPGETITPSDPQLDQQSQQQVVQSLPVEQAQVTAPQSISVAEQPDATPTQSVPSVDQPQTTPVQPATQTPDQLPAQQSTAQVPNPYTVSIARQPGGYEDDYESQDQELSVADTVIVNWTASEYVAHDKSAKWYISVMLVALIMAAIVFAVTRDIISPVVVIILGGAFAAFGARKPQVLEYSIQDSGVHIGQRHYPYSMFKTFSIIEEEAMRSILLMPLQRFNLPISIYYDLADEQQIAEALSKHLPHEERELSPLDNLMRKIRF